MAHINQKIAIITDKHFWIDGFGANMRIQSLVNYLQEKAHLSVYVLDTLEQETVQLFNTRHPDVVLEHFSGDSSFTRENCHEVLGQWLENERFDTVIVEHLWNHWIAEIIPDYSQKILDTHDILSLQIESFARYGRKHPIKLSIAQEFAMYSKFDRVMFIQQSEYEEGCRRQGARKCLLCPHPAQVQQKSVANPVATTVGFLSSPWLPNLDALIWLANYVVPLVKPADTRFEVYGTICDAGEIRGQCPGLSFRGPVRDLRDFYDAIDIVVNPCQYGSGMKIKSMEALAFGKPLVTTTIGAQGLESAAGRAFLMTNSPEEFAAHITRILQSETIRRDLGTQAREFVAGQFTPDICFGGLLADNA